MNKMISPEELNEMLAGGHGCAGVPYSAVQILQAISDGVYVTNRNRKIVYWNKAAERITGWKAEEVVGRSCFDDILCHTDKDGHQLCGEEHCPLHRAMTTSTASAAPVLVFARTKSGDRVPVQVNVAPIINEEGKTIGGVEIFRDCSAEIRDLERAKTIQALSMQLPAPDQSGVRFAAKYLPHGVLGGDFYTVEKLDDKRFAFCLADVMGHGTAAGLYAMHLHSLWENNRRVIDKPATFVSALNRSLCSLVRDNESFATGLFGLIDLQAEAVALCAAGSPAFILYRGNKARQIKLSSLPLGLIADHIYEVTFLPLEPGDGLLLYTDGATEINDRQHDMLGNDGLVAMINKYGFPRDDAALTDLVEKLLRFSDQIRFPDDITLLAISYDGPGPGK